LNEGADADLVFYFKDLETQPLTDPLENLIFSHSSRTLKHVMVRGEWVLYNQKPVKVELEDLNQEFQKALKKFKELV
jgi:cytosine/adenosine deaminase-related metal-dependent hydrolase